MSQLNLKELKKGEYYRYHYTDGYFAIGICLESGTAKATTIFGKDTNYKTGGDTFQLNSWLGGCNHCEPASPTEKQWLDACIKANRYLSYQEFERDYLKTQSTGSTPTELTSLPEKWYIVWTEPAITSAVNKAQNNQYLYVEGAKSTSDGRYYSYDGNVPSDYTQITFDQFKKWVLKENNTNVAQPSKESLLEEAKRRYLPGTLFNSTGGRAKQLITETSKIGYNMFGTQGDIEVINDVIDNGKGTLYSKSQNKWAEIIEMPAAKQSEPPSVPEYVEALQGSLVWAKNVGKITVGKIYSFPEITLDCGYKLSLIKDMSVWVREFKPSTKEAYERQQSKDWKPNVGEYIYFLDKVSYHGKGDVAKVINCDDWKTGDKEWIDVFGKRKDGFAWPNYKHLVRPATPEEIGESSRNPLMTSLDWTAITPHFTDFFPDYFKKSSPSVKPSSKVSVKSHEEFKINIIKPKTIKL